METLALWLIVLGVAGTGLWLYSGYAAPSRNRLIVAFFVTWVVTTIIGTAVFCVMVAIRRHVAAQAVTDVSSQLAPRAQTAWPADMSEAMTAGDSAA